MDGSRGEAGRGGGRGVVGSAGRTPTGFENNIKYPSSLQTLGGLAKELGLDYPTYATIPDTSFTCSGKNTGYYADPEAGCQVKEWKDGSLLVGKTEG